MARALEQFGHFLKKMLEQLAVRTEDGRLIYQDMSCMSWVAVCNADAFSRKVAPGQVSPQLSAVVRAKYGSALSQTPTPQSMAQVGQSQLAFQYGIRFERTFDLNLQAFYCCVKSPRNLPFPRPDIPHAM
jgi:hypothetical protein